MKAVLSLAILGALGMVDGIRAQETFVLSGMATFERQEHTATLLGDGRVMVAGGKGYNGDIGVCEIYDPAVRTWSRTGSLAMQRRDHCATLLADGRVLITGGFDDYNVPLLSELYDPATGLWSAAGSLTMARNGHTATLMTNGKVLVVGGKNTADGTGTTYTTRVETYDTATGKWGTTSPLSAGRAGHTATLLANGKVLVAGGMNASGYLSTCMLYSPSAGSWAATGALKAARTSHTATLLPDGRVLVTGGSGGTSLATTEIYDPAKGTWSAGGNMTATRRNHAATLLPDGRVLITGGVNNTTNPPNSEFYDVPSNSCIAGPRLVEPRELHTATLLADGQVLLAGGFRQGPERVTELYATPTIIEQVASSVTGTGVSLSAFLSGTGSAPISARGFIVAPAENGAAALKLGGPGVIAWPATYVAGTVGNFRATITGLTPGASYRFCAYGTNAVGDGYSAAVTFTTLTALEAWRSRWYGTKDDSGSAADLADPYSTGVPNLLAFSLLGPEQNPALARPALLPQPGWNDGRYGYSISPPAGVSGVKFEAEQTESLQEGSWTPLSDTGSGGSVRFELPASGDGSTPKGFLRLKITRL